MRGLRPAGAKKDACSLQLTVSERVIHRLSTGLLNPNARWFDRVGMTHTPKTRTWMEILTEWDIPWTEENVWDAIAEANDLDSSEISDGDLTEWL